MNTCISLFFQIFVKEILLSVIICIIIIHPVYSTNDVPCRRPTKDKLKQIKTDFLQQKATYFSDSFNQLYLSSRKNYHDIDKRFISQKSMKIGWTSKTCPHFSYYNPCPHYLQLDVDENRIPKVLLKAKCKCTECFRSDGHRTDEPDQTGLGCKEVYHYAIVMRATGCQENGEMKYEEVLEPVAVGCACKRSERTSTMLI